MLEVLIVRINMVENHICVPLMTRCENSYLIVLIHNLQHLMSVWPDIEASLVVFARLKPDVKFDIRYSI